MNIPPIQQGPPMQMGQMPQPNNSQMAQAAQVQQQQQQQQQSQEKLDNISKVKSLVVPLKEALALAVKSAATTFHQNSLVDVGSLEGIEPTDQRFNKHFEEVFSICDQIELHLKTSIECLSQSSSAVRYMPMPVVPTRVESLSNQDGPTLTYPQFLLTVKGQVGFFREVHDTLVTAAQVMSD